MDEIVATTNETAKVILSTRKRRFFAFLIDTFIIAFFGKLLGTLFGDFFVQLGDYGKIIGFAVVSFYFGIGNSKLSKGQTLGKKLLKIRVVNKFSKTISVFKSFLRAIPFAVFILLNGTQVPETFAALSIIFSTIIFSIPILEIYFFIVNRHSLQSLHDLWSGTFVVTVKSEGCIDSSNKKPLLYIGTALPLVIAIACFGATTLAVNKFAYIADMQKIMNTAINELPISAITIYRHKTTTSNLNGESIQEKSIEVTAKKKNKNDDENTLALKIAKIIFDSGFAFEEGEALSINIIYGYDIGIASNFIFKAMVDSIGIWKKEIQHIGIINKVSQHKSPSNGFKDNLWRNVAGSPYIVSGTLNVDTNRIHDIKNTKSAFLEFKFSVDTLFKGNLPEKEIIIRKTICDKYDKGPRCNDTNLVAYNGQKVIIPIYRSNTDSTQYAIRSNSAKAILLETEENRTKVTNEIARQNEIIESKAYAEICPIATHSEAVKALIEDMQIASKAEEAYAKLEALGTSAIYAIICQMDDRRELAIKSITLENKYPGVKQATRTYTPQVVIDVLAAILHQVAHFELGFIMNGASEELRSNTLNAWRVFMWYVIND